MHPVKKSIIDFILGAIITMSINFLVVEALGLQMPISKTILLHFGTWTFVYFIMGFPRWLIPPIALGSTAALGIYYHQGLLNIEHFWDFKRWAIEFMLGMDTTINLTYSFYLIVVLFTVVGWITGFILLRLRSTFLLSSWSIFFIMEWYRYIDGAIGYFNIFIFGIILFYLYESHLRYIKKIDEDHQTIRGLSFRNRAIYGVISVLLMISTANLISVKFDPISFQRINDTVLRIFPPLKEWRSDGGNRDIESGFAFEETPYQINKEKLGGKVREDRSTIMLVAADRQLYLRGRVKNQYTGNNWLASQGTGIEFDEGAQKQAYKGIFYEEVEVFVYPTNIRTNTVFAPYKPVQVTIDKYKVLKTRGDELYITKSIFKPRPQAYIIHSRIPIIKEASTQYDTKGLGTEMKDYLQLPSTLSPRIKGLTREITDIYPTPYEKMKGIEKYLRETYPYTLIVNTLPDNKDFVEYFLYEEKKGYCTYFASAMAVMGRTIGVPTRYVEGFILPRETNQAGYYEVTADRAHAWVEAYFDGMGWIAFEPTPSYNIQRFEANTLPQWKINIESVTSSQMQNPDYLTFKNRLDEEFAGLDATFNRSERKELRGAKLSNSGKKAMAWGLGLVILILLLRIGCCIHEIRKLRRAKGTSGAIQYYYETIVSFSEHIQPYEDEELTPREVLQFLGKYMITAQGMDEIIHIIEKGLYSNKDLSQQELEVMQAFEEDMENIVKKRLGIRLFLYYKFIKGSLYTVKPPRSFAA